MKRFRFQLQTAMDWRQRRMEFEQAALEELENSRRQLQSELKESLENWQRSQEATVLAQQVRAEDLRALGTYRLALDALQLRLQRSISALEVKIAAQRKKLVEATRDYRLLEKLKDRKVAEWRKELEKELENQASELYLAQWNRHD